MNELAINLKNIAHKPNFSKIENEIQPLPEKFVISLNEKPKLDKYQPWIIQ